MYNHRPGDDLALALFVFFLVILLAAVVGV